MAKDFAAWLNETQKDLEVGGKAPTNQQILLAVATALGAWGGFPEPPKQFNQFVRSPVVQYALVFVLLMQGGASANYKLAGIVTGIMYVSHRLLE